MESYTHFPYPNSLSIVIILREKIELSKDGIKLKTCLENKGFP